VTSVSEQRAEPPAPDGPVGSIWRSTAVMFGSRGAIQLLSVAKGIAVARLLGPTDLGSFFLVSGVVGALEIASHPGLQDALIDADDERPRRWHAAWTFLVIRGAVISALLMLAAPPIAAWLRAPDLVPLLRVVALVPFIRGFTSLSLDWRARRVDLRPTATTELVANIAELTAGIVLAALTHSAWGLIAAMLIGVGVRTAWSYRYSGFRPRVVLSLTEVRPLMRFGKWRFGSNVLYYVSTRADDVLVGRYLGRAPLGSYRIAYRLANLPTTEIVSVLETVAFPALAVRARESREWAISTYSRYLTLTCGLAGPMAAVSAALAQPVVAALLGPAYANAAVPLAIMCVAGYLRALVSTAGSLVLGLGRPALDTAMGAMRAVVLVVAIIILAPHGVVGAAVASLLSLLVTVPVWMYSLWRVDARPLHAVAVAIGRLPVAAAAGGAAWAVAHLPLSPLVKVLVGSVAGLLAWVVATVTLDRPLADEVTAILRRLNVTRFVSARWPWAA
jgi:PST family polysaccharide transporter